MEEQQIKAFSDTYGLKYLIRQSTCYKSPSNSTCTDLFLTNALQKFQSTCVLEIGLSDFHLMSYKNEKYFGEIKTYGYKLQVLQTLFK